VILGSHTFFCQYINAAFHSYLLFRDTARMYTDILCNPRTNASHVTDLHILRFFLEHMSFQLVTWTAAIFQCGHRLERITHTTCLYTSSFNSFKEKKLWKKKKENSFSSYFRYSTIL